MAVVGCGPIGALHAQAIADSPCAVLVAVCDPNRERLASMAKRYHARPYADVRQLLASERPAAVTIATPDHLHVEPALAAIAAGCHVFCEKPLADTAAAAGEVVRAASQRGVRLAVDYNRRFAFGYRTARRLVDEGAIGALQTLLVRVSDTIPPPAVARHEHVIFTTLLTHHLDLARHFGGEIRRVSVTSGERRPGTLLSNVSLSLELASGAIGTIIGSYRECQARTAEWMELRGSGGTIVVEDVTRRVMVTRADPDQCEVFEPSPFAPGAVFYDSLIEHVQIFLEQVAGGGELPVTGLDGLHGLIAAEAAIESVRTGRPIEVPT